MIGQSSGRRFFIDMNAFFASVEQQERPELRGKPILIAPMLSDSTCAIAASYEAKRLGIKTGTSVRTARRLCPEVTVVEARPHLYMEYHRGILETLNARFVDVQALSVDEMACGVDRLHGSRELEEQLGREVKRGIAERLGPLMRCSVGIAPNVFLAKVAGDVQKPDGLTVWRNEDLPGALFDLDLQDLPGIGSRMAIRLERHGIRTVERLMECSSGELRRAWGSVVGAQWWHMLRGSAEADYGRNMPEVRKSVGHSHVLPPEFRTETGVRTILMRLFSKCMARLRKYGQAAGAVQVWIDYRHERTFATYGAKRRSGKHLHANDEVSWIKTVRRLGEAIPAAREGYRPLRAGIVFTDLILCKDMNLSLFDDPIERTMLGNTTDALNAKHGYVVDVASIFWLHENAPFRIAFGQVQ